MMAMSPTARTMQHFKRKQWALWNTETWDPRLRIRRDAFGFIDLVVLDMDRRKHLGLQVTSYSNISARVRKIRNQRRQNALAWIYTGGVVEVWGWKEYADRASGGDWAGCWWRPRIVEITEDDLRRAPSQD